MSQFNYADYQKVVEAAQAAQNGTGNAVKVGFFKLKDDGDEALVRINCGSLDDLQFASVHQIWSATTKMKVSCANPLGSYQGHCALCEAAKQGLYGVGKASKKVYLQMIASYKDPATGTFTEPTPVVWERPAMFSRDIANKMRDWGDLRNVLFKITRNGKAGDMKTTYSLDVAPNTVYKPEMVPADFSAFTNFDVSRHSFYEKTPEEINTFMQTGTFPERPTTNATPKPAYTAPATPVAPQPQFTPANNYNQTPANAYTAPAQSIYPGNQAPQPAVINPANVQPAAPQPAVINPANPNPAGAPVQTAQPTDAGRPARNFAGFSW